ncbi:hypothetical protein BJN34_17175 [Cupriavidus necator]|uniref:Uncharacterized protein n=1 Tax=Cupriavidus necator TaxID=106590 RepID=A0A1U9UTX8_CUPNE|nr:retron St85 family effector protein [Cupriavidus necator]AQV95615.1 hypothetical protein BJN34_17175 [Cupriavidus necator]
MQVDLQDPRPSLLADIDITNCRVEFSNTPIVLLCGGQVKIKNKPDDPDPPLASLRDAITRRATDYEIFRPEEITSWHADGVYKNLMDFESDLASICSLVVVVMESAGSLVELGAFSQLPDFKKKIIAIASSDFVDDISFINLGILRYIKEYGDSRVKSYPWSVANPRAIEGHVVDDVISDIKDELAELKQSQTFRSHIRAHEIILICELVRLFHALKEVEILEYLHSLGLDTSKDNLRSKLFVLMEFRVIKRVQYSDSTFFMRDHEPFHKIRFSFKSEQQPDALRLGVECLEYYSKDPKQKHRHRAITRAASVI